MVQIKRVYSEPSAQDGIRILVDRVWPRGCTKERARLDGWQKELAPSTALRKWFGHDPRKWHEFRSRYLDELAQPEPRKAIENLTKLARSQTLTLLFGASDLKHNQAVVLKELIDREERE
ncbi:MAG: hypothetical protein LZF60_220004 [Nitrospira sp.]|nr:MAG: hypothetical protein LZF60_220004 [Nitrospira sp.]